MRSRDAESMFAYLGGSGSGPARHRKLNNTEDMSFIVVNTLFRWVRLGPGGRCKVITRSIQSESGYESSLGPVSVGGGFLRIICGKSKAYGCVYPVGSVSGPAKD